jgi:glyoxylase-like metal-dependent hydrolase (beta-lactamase superfamily II)
MGGIGLLFKGTPSILVQGDTLFRDGVGRTDLFGGNWSMLLSSINEKIFVLPDDTTVVCGHGGDTTVGHEKAGFAW